MSEWAEPKPFRLFLLAAFIATVPVSNYVVGHVGACGPDGICLIPVWPGLMAPSAVLIVGVALVLRDAVQERCGRLWAFGAIVLGALLSLLVAPPSLALASAAAFLLAEMADLLVYSRLRARGLAWAVLASGVVGAALDSLVFLWLAFGTPALVYLPGQIVGKLWATLAVALVLALRPRGRSLAT